MKNLVEQSKNGNTFAFTELILNYKEDLYRIAKMRLDNNYDIDDAVQETMLEAFSSIKRLKKNEYFKTWLIKILLNKCNKIYFKNKRQRLLNNNLSSDTPNVTGTISDMESDLGFYSLIAILNYNERIVMILYYVYEYTIKDISRILKTNENTIKTRLARGKEKIKVKGGLVNG